MLLAPFPNLQTSQGLGKGARGSGGERSGEWPELRLSYNASECWPEEESPLLPTRSSVATVVA